MPYPRRTVQLLEVKGKPRSPDRPRSRDSSYTTSSGRCKSLNHEGFGILAYFLRYFVLYHVKLTSIDLAARP